MEVDGGEVPPARLSAIIATFGVCSPPIGVSSSVVLFLCCLQPLALPCPALSSLPFFTPRRLARLFLDRTGRGRGWCLLPASSRFRVLRSL